MISKKINYTNIVMIKTAQVIGSGIIFNCKVDKQDYEQFDREYKSYCIITSAHVIYEYLNGISDIRISIYDIKNERIELTEDDIIEKNSNSYDSDIVAMLVKISCDYDFEINNNIKMLDWNNDGIEVYSKGFPGVLQSGHELIPVTVTGINQLSYKLSKGIYSYRMNEEFHFYDNYSDEDFYGGLSGGPVLVVRNDKTMLIGINESIEANINGDNPYKLVNYISLKAILDYLRMSGYIIFDINDDKIDLIWVYKKSHQKGIDLSVDKSFLVMGSSGAGKSSFINKFCKNTLGLFFNGDGQTTRMDVFYFLNLYCCNPQVKIKFQSSEQYKNKRYNEVIIDVIMKLYNEMFDICIEDIKVEPIYYLSDTLRYMKAALEYLELNNEVVGIVDRIQETCINFNKSNDDIFIGNSYILFLKLLYFLKCNSKLSKKTIRSIFDVTKRQEYLVHLKNLIEDNIESDKIKFPELKKAIKNQKVNISVNSTKIYLDENGIQQYIEFIIDNQTVGDEGEEKYNFGQKILLLLKMQEGYFDFGEYSYLFKLKNTDEDYLTWIKDCCKENKNYLKWIKNHCKQGMNEEEFYRWIESSIIDELILDNNPCNGLISDSFEFIEEIFKSIYEKLIQNISTYYNLKIETDRELCFNLLDIKRDDLEFINICLTIYKKRSLSSLILSVDIIDYISDEYATLFYNNNIKKILLIDTCGLDHVGKDRNLRQMLRKRVNDYSIIKSYGKYYMNSIIYVKKLDSGHPTEIQDILSYVVDDTDLAFYCVFNGSDIYELTNGFFPVNKDWHLDKNDKNYPKIFKYIKSEFNKDQLLSDCKACRYRKDRVFYVMSKNMITFCSNDSILINDQNRYKANNMAGLNSLLKSIKADEIHFANYVEASDNEYENLLNKGKESLQKLIKIWFDYASMKTWPFYYYKTVNANIQRISHIIRKEIEIGYYGTYDFRWYTLFRNAYIKVINKYSNTFTNQMDKFSDITSKHLRRLYSDYEFFSIDYGNEETIKDKNSLNYIFMKMCNKYEKINEEFINPYKESEVYKNKINGIRYNKTFYYAKQMNLETDFGKIIGHCKEECTELANIIIKKLLDYYNKDYGCNSKYVEKIKEFNPEWYDTISDIIDQMKKYGYSNKSINKFMNECIIEVKEQ